MFNMYELDDRGILPYCGEKEEQFVRRGNATLAASAGLSDTQLINRVSVEPIFIMGLHLNRFICGSFDYDDAMRQEALAYMLIKYGMDLTWVRFFEISTNDAIANKLGGFAMRQDWRFNNISVVVPVIFIRDFFTRIMTHELIHAGRADILEGYRRYYDGSTYYASDIYEERVAHNQFYCSNFRQYFSLNGQIRNTYRLRRKLEKYFGNKAGYIFVRLSFKEAMHSLLEARNPAEFIRERSYDNPKYCYNLKFQIMTEKLGL